MCPPTINFQNFEKIYDVPWDPVGYLSLLLSLYMLFNLTKSTIFMDDNKPLCYVFMLFICPRRRWPWLMTRPSNIINHFCSQWASKYLTKPSPFLQCFFFFTPTDLDYQWKMLIKKIICFPPLSTNLVLCPKMCVNRTMNYELLIWPYHVNKSVLQARQTWLYKDIFCYPTQMKLKW